MILQALTAYYEQLLAQNKVDAPGWDKSFKVSFELRLNDAGELIDVVDLRTPVQKGKKTVLVPREISVPVHTKRSSGVAANFLCDTSSYLLGADEKGKPERAVQCFEAAAKLHHELLDDAENSAARAILSFFNNWNPIQVREHPKIIEKWKDISASANLIFGYESVNHSHYLASEDPPIQEAWRNYYGGSSDEGEKMQCLVMGQELSIARLHPNIKGVWGAQSAGASLVSFNEDAFCSYEHKQGTNAPVSEYAANAYTTALNYLLSDRNHCKHIGDTTMVCWAENASSSYQTLGMAAIFGVTEDTGLTESDVMNALKQMAQGKPFAWNNEALLPDQHFYVLGLAPNAARVSVRFFLRDTFGGFAAHLRQHHDELDIICPANEKTKALSVWALAMETVNRNENDPKPAPQLVGDLLRSVLAGGRYPASLLNGVALRIRAEQEVTYGRAAILKAYYSRNGTSNENFKEVLTVKLNEESTYAPYVLGRLFAVMEAIQKKAKREIDTTIRDRYFNSACTTPAVVFPTLINLAQKHLNKIGGGKEAYFNAQIAELLGKLDEDFPAHLTLQEQGAFQIGYYHQQRYAKKEEE